MTTQTTSTPTKTWISKRSNGFDEGVSIMHTVIARRTHDPKSPLGYPGWSGFQSLGSLTIRVPCRWDSLMAAIPRSFTFQDDPTNQPPHVFAAKFPGECAGCGQRFESGDEVMYRDDELCIAHECESPADITISRNKIRVMPHGRTAKDKCPRCFIVHASGQVECE